LEMEMNNLGSWSIDGSPGFDEGKKVSRQRPEKTYNDPGFFRVPGQTILVGQPLEKHERRSIMLSGIKTLGLIGVAMFVAGCAAAYKAQPLPFRAPSSYGNAVAVAGVTVGGEAFADPKKAQDAFGFDVRGAGMLPVEVVFDNEGPHSFRINAGQTFLEDHKGNLWPILDDKTAYDRTTKYAQTKHIFKEGAYSGFLGATAGAVIGAAIGIVSGGRVGEAAGRGAALGAAAGATMGGIKGSTEASEPRRTIINDLNRKSLENKAISRGLSYGFLFFPGEAQSAKELRLQLVETDTGATYALRLVFGAVKTGGNTYSQPLVTQVSPGSISAQPAAQTAPPPVPPTPSEPGGTVASAPGDQAKCREWKIIDRHMESKLDPSTGQYREVPVEKWGWVEVPCDNDEGATIEEGDVNISPPPEYELAAPPSVAVIPGTYVYLVPGIGADILFYDGYWYRPYRSHWFRARSYNGPWAYLATARVPRVLIDLPGGYRRLPPGYHRIAYGEFQRNWRRWEGERYWHRDREWREYSRYGGHRGRRD
jgi:hypothetical protein